MNRQVEVTWKTLRTIAHSHMVHVRVFEAYIHFALIYTIVKIDKFGWWGLEIISVDVGLQFTSTEFKEECQTCGVHLILSALEHQ